MLTCVDYRCVKCRLIISLETICNKQMKLKYNEKEVQIPTLELNSKYTPKIDYFHVD